METPSKKEVLMIKKENTMHECLKNIQFEECSFKMNSIDKNRINID